MICQQHKGRDGKPDTMRVDYFCGFRRFSAWVCLGHADRSFPRNKAEQWWRAHGGQGKAPRVIEKAVALSDELKLPRFIRVWVNTKYPEIVDYDFRGTRFELPPELGGPALVPMVDEKEERARKLAREMFDDEIPF